MTKEELIKLIRDTAGEEVAAAVKRIDERRADAGVTQHARGLVDADRKEQDRTLRLGKDPRGQVFGGVVAALARAKGNQERAIEIAGQWKMPEVEKALTAGNAEEGGFTIGVEHSDEIIDLLTPRTVVRRYVDNITPLDAGVATVSRLTASANVTWGGEITKIRRSQQAFGLLTLRSKFEKVIVPISNTLLRRGGPRVANAIRFDTLRAMSLGEDEVFLEGDGTEHRPKGLYNWILPTQKFNATGGATPTLDQVTGDLGRVVLALEEQNVGMTSPFWVMAPRTKQALATVRIPNGPFAFRDEIMSGQLWGWPLESTTKVPTNLGGGQNESFVMLTDGDEITIGQGASLQVALSEEAVIVDEDGTIHSAFQQDMTFMRVINEVDLMPRHQEGIAALEGVTWAPGTIVNP